MKGDFIKLSPHRVFGVEKCTDLKGYKTYVGEMGKMVTLEGRQVPITRIY